MYTQTNRPIAVTTPLGKDVMLLAGFSFQEGISQLFHGQLDLLTEKKDIPFEKLMGQKVTIRVDLPRGRKRYLSGICSAFWEGGRDPIFTHYRLEMVPQLWLLTQRRTCRIFQHMTVPDILKKVFEGLDVHFALLGTFHPREYCVQYRESDFDFASRLMEEEGIFYFFKHTADAHQLVLANTPVVHPEVPEQTQIVFGQEKVVAGEMRISQWEKGQQLRSGKVTLWDRHFQLPHQHLEAEKSIVDNIKVGSVVHRLKPATKDRLEIYDYPGGYAQHHDGIDKGGGDQAAALKRIFEDNQRTAVVRMQAEALPSVQIQGAGNCRQLVSGHKFTLDRHFNGDGEYVLTHVEHTIRLGANYHTGQDAELAYQTTFRCIPAALPFRPPQATRKPIIEGIQTATVVGPPGEEVFTDKFGRVKVQFPWDRQGKKNADSSCWLRVSQFAAGKGFGAISLPRIGQEVVVGFLQGDPDQPLVLGCLYNAENMPPYPLPQYRNYSGMRHQSVGGVRGNASEIRFQNQLGRELLVVHAETDSLQQAENNHLQQVGKVHRHEVGQFYHTIIGKPVNVNQAMVGTQANPTGSGAGGGPPKEITVEDLPQGGNSLSGPEGSGAGGGQPNPPPDTKRQDPHEFGALVQIYGPNTNETFGDNSTEIHGDDHYSLDGSSFSDTKKNSTTNVHGDNNTTIDGNDTYNLGGTAHSEIQGDNHTEIHGIDYYKAHESASSVTGKERSYSANKDEATILHVEGDAVHLEAAGIHVELNGIKLDTDGIKKAGCPFTLLSFG
jgi:type VI secretion system secreted protein VgrG